MRPIQTDIFNNTILYLYLYSFYFAGSYYGSECQLCLYTQFYTFIFRCRPRFPEFMTNPRLTNTIIRGFLEKSADKFDCERTTRMIPAKLIEFKLDVFSYEYVKICLFSNAPKKIYNFIIIYKICFTEHAGFLYIVCISPH